MKKKNGLSSMVENVARNVKQKSYKESSGDDNSQARQKPACQSTPWEKEVLSKIFYREKVDVNHYQSGGPISRNFCPFPAEYFLLEIQMFSNSSKALLRAVLLMLAYNYGGDGRVALSLNKLTTLLKTDRRIVRNALQELMDIGLIVRTDGKKEMGYGMTEYFVKVPAQCLPRKNTCQKTGGETPPLGNNSGMSNNRVGNHTQKPCQMTGGPPVNQHPLSIKNQYIKNKHISSSSSQRQEGEEVKILNVWHGLLGLNEVTTHKRVSELNQLVAGLGKVDRKRVLLAMDYLPKWPPFKESKPRSIKWLLQCLPNLMAELEQKQASKRKTEAIKIQAAVSRKAVKLKESEINQRWDALDEESRNRAIEKAKQESQIRIGNMAAMCIAKSKLLSQIRGTG